MKFIIPILMKKIRDMISYEKHSNFPHVPKILVKKIAVYNEIRNSMINFHFTFPLSLLCIRS